jgi:8-oxo-dGTP pyrophosphatase MutT (NUDIX family)
MRRRLYTLFLRVYAHIPRRVRRVVIRVIQPSYTMGAICVIERPDGAVLLVHQAYRKHWGIPGGLVKRGEEPSDAARREVFEEIGMAVELVGEPAVVVDPEAQRIDIVFRARPVTLSELDHVRPVSPEIHEVRWFAPDALPRLQVETASALVALARSSAAPQSTPLPR